MAFIPRPTRRRFILLLTSLFITLSTTFLLLPPTSPIRLSINFNASRLFNSLRASATDRDAWLHQQPPPYPLNLRDEVGYLVKTGYGTRHRVPALMKAFSHGGNILSNEKNNFIVVGDWTPNNQTDDGLPIVYNVVNTMMKTKVDLSLQSHPRFAKYRSLQEAVDSADEDKAREIGQEFGWELDALKQWYIILDDDTFLIEPSLHLLLSHLDPSRPYYLGNAVGDYKTRFAHGGSGIVLSREVMRRLFDRPDIVAQSYIDSLDETWGDRLVGLTLIKLGIYLDERYSHHFNGEPPDMARVQRDRFCSPIVSFHGARRPGAMEAIGQALSNNREQPVIWAQLWQLFADTSLDNAGREPVRQMRDYVGPTGEDATTWERIASAEVCRKKCRNRKSCLAWTYDREMRTCRASPWIVIGNSSNAETNESGLDWQAVEPLLRQCGRGSL
ncbi:glycosyltransferase family 31 protein [Trichoderma harzianum CBS 226.95]|uniref:N-acetylgalactosaminide beta-1,3-galactosyltransferase n=1 Tax=Trichoderma harzianum CBS 226.95 TaxID=983964 RepID=A0A2T4ANA8_TRIHA|nr:glycosyltransferase family 31 protein [Trichoderma harzianum CBS 226.95]PTB58564.1 glycosyltransferase family 31 protein [Trichoderma harzianum CBS 226.95]